MSVFNFFIARRLLGVEDLEIEIGVEARWINEIGWKWPSLR
jgi:hypothetical protein